MESTKYSVQVNELFYDIQMFQSQIASISRSQDWSGPDWYQTDISGNFWAFVFFEAAPGAFFFLHNNERIEVGSNTAFCLPPFSVFSTLTLQGKLRWRALVSFKKPPLEFPTEPVLMRWDAGENLKSMEDIWQEALLQRASWRRVGTTGDHSKIALKVKHLIDSNFSEKIRISEICRKAGVSHEVADRAFKGQFGITPQLYRRKLRTAEAMALMILKGYNVSRASLDVGYSDIDNFSKQFRKHF